MKSVSQKIAIIIIVIVLILSIGGGVFAYLYLATDTFKEAEELFFKYMNQNLEQIEELANSKTLENYKTIKSGQEYESDTVVTVKYAEGGETSNPFNDLTINLQNQRQLDYSYKDLQILYDEQNAIEIEGIKEDDLYGIRFTNLLKQFVSLEDGQMIEGLDISEDTLDSYIAIIEDDSSYFQDIILSTDEIKSLEEKYVSIITEALKEGTISKQGKVVVTANSITTTANAYTVELTAYQTQNLMIEILNNIKIEDIILNKIQAISGSTENFENIIDDKIREIEDKSIGAMSITVYEEDGITIKTLISSGTYNITIENIAQGNSLSTIIEYSEINDEEEISRTIEISKQSTDIIENYNIVCDVVNGDEQYTLEATLESDYERTDISIGYKKGITEIVVSAENTLETTVGEIVELDSDNNTILNELTDDNLTRILDILNVQVPEKLKDRYNLLLTKLQAKDLETSIKGKIQEIFGGTTLDNDTDEEENNGDGDQTSTEADDLTKTEVNKFNAKFEFYTGTGISAENVKILIDVAKDNLESVDIIPITNDTSSQTRESIQLNIKIDTVNEELAESITQRIDDTKKYDVSVTYNETNGVIETITITPQK